MTRILSELPPSSGVGQPTIGRPFYVQAKGQLWPTRAFYAECAQVMAGRQSRNADFISIAAKSGYPQPSALRAVKPKNLRGESPVKLQNPHARQGVSISKKSAHLTMRRFLYSTETSSILKFSSFPAIS